ncbi:MAG: hypothetical protein ACR652_07315 [Methylocystis sp.]
MKSKILPLIAARFGIGDAAVLARSFPCEPWRISSAAQLQGLRVATVDVA